MSQRLVSPGITVSYAIEATAGTRPTTGYVKIGEIKSTPSTNPEPNTIEVTPLEEMFNVLYEFGLSDSGGAFGFPINVTEDGITAWNDTAMTAYETAIATGKGMWISISHPKLSVASFVKVSPRKITGFNETSVNSVFETAIYAAPQSSFELAAAPTFAAA